MATLVESSKFNLTGSTALPCPTSAVAFNAYYLDFGTVFTMTNQQTNM
jgi:hypothetical protein